MYAYVYLLIKKKNSMIVFMCIYELVTVPQRAGDRGEKEYTPKKKKEKQKKKKERSACKVSIQFSYHM